MNRRDRDRYDHDNYDRDDYSGGAGYDRNDEHYHSARNLTNEFERDYRRHHPDMQQDRYDRSNMRRSYHEGDMGDAYERMREGSRHRDSGYNMQYGGRDRSNWGESRNRSQDWSSSDRYSTSGRYSQRSGDFDRDRDMRRGSWSGSSDRSDRMQQADRRYMSRDSLREGYGISDYGRMRPTENIHSSRGVPNAGITSSFEDDYGTDLESNRSHRISSGNYGGYGSQGGGYGRDRDDRY